MEKVVVRSLEPGSVVVVRTMNSEYRLTVTDPLNRRAEVAANIYCGTVDVVNEVIRAGGSLLLGVVSNGNLIRTSLVKSVKVQGPKKA